MTTAEAAKHLKVSPLTLKKWRHEKRGPNYAQRSKGRQVRYRREDLDAWISGPTRAVPKVTEAPAPKRRGGVNENLNPHAWIQDLWHTADDPGPGGLECTECRKAKGARLWQKKAHGQGSRWQVIWYDLTGKREKKNCKTKPEADKTVREINAKLAAGLAVNFRALRTTVAEYAPVWFAAQTCSASTAENYERHLRLYIVPRLGNRMISQLDRDEVSTFLAQLPVSDTYANTIFATLAGLLYSAAYKGLTTVNPALRIKRRGNGRVLIIPWPPEMLHAVLRALEDRHPRWLTVALVGSMAGLRPGETFGLAHEDVDHRHGLLHVRRQVQWRDGIGNTFCLPKGGKTRSVRMSPELGQALAEHGRSWPARTVRLPWHDGTRHLDPKKMPTHEVPLVFTGIQGGATSASWFRQWVWHRALDDAGVVDHTRKDGLHMLRHYFVREMLDAGAPIEAVSQQLAHSSPAFTIERYGHLRPHDPADRLGKAAAAMGSGVLAFRA
ncbi:hypothetical protein DBP12_03600 [Streptomyces sp. CS014]|nr:hypothetical protein DBP12_03600 [Streptomyces sp. CS014]